MAGINPSLISSMTIPSGLQSIALETYFAAKPQVADAFVFGPGHITGQARDDTLSAYAYANTLPVSGAVDDRSAALGGQTFTRGV